MMLHLAALGLQPRGDVGSEGPVLALDSPHLGHDSDGSDGDDSDGNDSDGNDVECLLSP